MGLIQALRDPFAGQNMLILSLWAIVLAGAIAGVVTGFFRARKIQPRGFKWKRLRTEVIVTVLSVPISGVLLGWLRGALNHFDLISIKHEPAAWWVIGLEFALYCLAFDTWFYWWHRAMHKEPLYTWVHKVHHWSTSPNVVSTTQVTPLESLINGGFAVLFTAMFTVHTETVALIGGSTALMGLYVHSGYEFLPRWWHKTWLTKWFISATFHDQHHHYFNYNFGGYFTIWDYLCGTVRPKFEHDFENPKARQLAKRPTERPAEPQPA
jgi:sterol desaturase/sphingolipid hydroxylase (fatty acid hydroxylase superfamily)